jgi:hypothetical protein
MGQGVLGSANNKAVEFKQRPRKAEGAAGLVPAQSTSVPYILPPSELSLQQPPDTFWGG